MKTAIYIRVSTEEQVKEGYSIQAQRNKLEAYCISQGWDIMGFYIDEGISAKDTERPELQRMIKHIEQGVIECVLVYRLDRLTRSVLDLYNLLDIFEKHHCKFKSATEVYDTTTAIGRMFITIVAALAQWERENLGERVKMGMQEKARQGKWTVSIPPYGYDKEGDDLVINKNEAVIVRKIFDLYLSGLSMRKIAVELNSLNVVTKSGAKWTDPNIKYILTNPIYFGTMRYNFRVNQENYFEIKDVAPLIINKDIFGKVQILIEKRSVSHPRAAVSEFIFSGIAKCGTCGSPLAGKHGQSKRGDKIYKTKSYYCTNQRLGLCKQPNISERYIEGRFLHQIDKIIMDSDLYEEKPINNNDEIQEKINYIHKELDELEKRRTKWQYGWANELINDADFTTRTQEENTKEVKYRQELSELKPVETLTPEDRKELLRDIKANWNELNPIEKKSFLQLTAKKITVSKISPRQKEESIHVDIEFY